jgi:gliding motility-associated-like protein
MGGGGGRDTLIYELFFEERNLPRAFFVDINAFGGQQVDRAKVYAIMADSSLKELGRIAFGNCPDCVRGFAFVHEGELQTQGVNTPEMMNMWLQSFNQPAYALPGNLQTLAGVGRISGTIPFCAIGFYVEYEVNSSPGSGTTEFSTHIICPQVVGDCNAELLQRIDCQNNELSLQATLPMPCFPTDAQVWWETPRRERFDGLELALPLAGGEGWYLFHARDEECLLVDSIAVDNPRFVEAGPDQEVCQGDGVALTGAGGSQQFWTLPGGGISEGAQLLIENAQLSQDGLYIFHAFNEEGCEDTDTLSLRVRIAPEPEVALSSACLGDTLFFILANDTLFREWRWLNPFGQTLTDPFIPDLQVDDFGRYGIAAEDKLGCDIRRDFPLSGALPPDVMWHIEETCDSVKIFLFPDTYQYVWNDGTEGSPLVSAEGGVYQVRVTDDNGCATLVDIVAPQPDGPKVAIEVDHPFCPNDYGAISFVPEDLNRPVIFSLDGGASYGVATRYGKLAPGRYDIVIQDVLGCVQKQQVEIIAPDTLGVFLDTDRLDVRPGTAVTLRARIVGNVSRYQWIPEAIDSGGPTTRFEANRDLDVRVIVEDERGCKASDGFPLSIMLGEIYVPNAFSPNGDRRNDRFTFYSDGGSGEVIETLRIFDRWGALVFEAREIALNDESLGWDGLIGGRPAPAAVYVYAGVVRFGNGLRKSIKGDVALLR